MKRMEIGAWRLALGGVKMLGWRTSDRASSVCVCGGLSENEENGNRSVVTICYDLRCVLRAICEMITVYKVCTKCHNNLLDHDRP